MAAEENKSFTEAQLQIERLRKLKEEKDEKVKTRKDDAFSFIEEAPADTAAKNFDAQPKPVDGITRDNGPAKQKGKRQRVFRVERRNFDKITMITKKIKSLNPGMRLSEDMLANLMITAVIDLNLDFSSVKTAEELKELLRSVRV
jgi:hypothetical protein